MYFKYSTANLAKKNVSQRFDRSSTLRKAFLLTSQAWEAHEAILVDGYLITCQPYEYKYDWWYGARYTKPFSPRFPHFEVRIHHFHDDII